MDPFSCLSIATAAVQFLDYGAKILHTSKQIYDDCSSVPIERVRKLNDDLIAAVTSLEWQTPGSNADERALSQLLEDCRELASELATLLESLLATYSQNRVFDSFVLAIRTILRKDSISEMEQRLSQYREEIMLRILVLLNAHRHALDDKLDALKGKSDEIVEIIALNFSQLRDDLDHRLQQTHTDLAMQKVEPEHHRHDIQAAILTTNQGQTLALTRPAIPNLASIYGPESGCQQYPTIFRQPKTNDPSSEILTDTQSLCTNAVKHILKALHFPRLVARRTAVTAAYEQTFDWVFNASHRSGESWDDLKEWLTHGSGCYWVNGKAGSGKSTFMKFMEDDVRTVEALKVWSQDSQLLIGSFYFWYAGSDLEKSQEGLFRAILYAAISRKPDLALTLFPDLYRSFLMGKSITPGSIALTELSAAFLKLAKDLPGDVKFCLFIDGIDEYEGDHNEVCKVLLQATKSQSFKALLSSRPIPSCVSAFYGCPQLGLHQLTKEDIGRYVESELGLHPLMVRMDKWEPGTSRQIVNTVTTRASGVFLWVVLVVKLLMSGIQEYDSLTELLERIDMLPPDLEHLYDQMLGSMSYRHRVEGSKMLQLVLRSTFAHGQYPLTLLQFFFAQEEGCKLHSLTGFSLPTPEEIDWRLESTEGRIRSRCCGLVEVADPGDTNGERTSKEVRFLHRTVVEFLQLRQIWNQITSVTRGMAFEVNDALLCSSILEIKAYSNTVAPSKDSLVSSRIRSIGRILTYTRTLNECNDSLLMNYLKELQQVVSLVWEGSSSAGKSQTLLQSTVTQLISSGALPLSFGFLIYATFHCAPEILTLLLKASFARPFLGHSLDGLPQTQNAPQHYYNLPNKLRDTPMMRSQKGASFEPSASPSELLAACVLLNFADSTSVHEKTAIIATVPLLLLGCGSGTPIQLPNQLGLLWQQRWKWTLPEGRQSWTPWEFLLLWAKDYSSSSDMGCIDYARSELPESCCRTFKDLIEQGLANDPTFSIQLGKRAIQSKRQVKSQNMSSAHIIRSFMLKTWTLRKPRIDKPTEADIRLARQMTELDDATKHMSEICQTEYFEDDHRIRRMQQKLPLTSKAVQSDAVSVGSILSKNVIVSREKRYLVEEKAHMDPASDRHPWRAYALLDVSQSANKPAAREPSPEPEEPQVMDAAARANRDRVWTQTPQHRRIQLLTAEEQDIANQLANVKISPKDQRSIQAKLSHLPLEDQSKVFECSSIIRTQSTSKET